MQGDLAVTGNPEADRLVNTEPLALLLAMMLDQQVPMEWAFISPWRLRERLGGALDADTIAGYDPEAFAALFKGPPALHRYPGSMAGRTQALCRHLVEGYEGNAAGVWEHATDGSDLLRRLEALPGYGRDKARIFTAVLAKRFGVRPPGWEQAAGPFADATPRSVADIDSAGSLAKVREFKQAQKKKGKGKAD
ncbi:MAG: HhH-GPD-type base excision DNA repair protein [Acidimicrobiia bacterium]